jgi:uncharacterized protein
MQELLANPTFISAFIAVTGAQLFKILFSLIISGRADLKSALSTGGMPSSHSATVAAVTTSVAVIEGMGSVLFAVSLVVSIIVIYDAVGIRRAAGRHAEVLNEWSRLLTEAFEHGFQTEDLKTLLGHTYPQVTAGIIFGIASSFFVHYLLLSPG